VNWIFDHFLNSVLEPGKIEGMNDPANHRNTNGVKRKVRVEIWLTAEQRSWLKTLAIREDRSMSSVLRRALGAYIHQVVEKQNAITRALTGDHRA